ncbi:zinc transporter ZIP13 homolog [Diorhabda carinulata]|uniref:zinc transporter ZIP13 homolog n=1 Tax=Diorhabda sublineata TaxID=1163346 RepID=UPI0024E047E2|nr:zinc transporter ZIP13 homolog [Diorhabda sublineata]XP_057667323.1 zinc transporter ZIP13 homolog [Diorhabda carinulata]
MTLLGNAFVCATDNNSTNFEDPYKDLVPDWICALEYVPWCWAIFGSLLVGLSGVLPLLVIPIDQSDNLKQGDSANKLKTLLSFAVGGLLGDVFLHSLPEIWANDTVTKFDNGHHISNSGLLILTGLIIFVAAEKLFSVIEQVENSEINTVENNNTKGLKQPLGQKKSVAGYLNLVANTMDNFTHGLSLGGAFLVSLRVGLLTTFAILVHEIPHEVGDFAILLKSGFTRWHAGIFQMLTASGGLIGAMAAIMFSGARTAIEARSSWILPFTAGTFLHIALVTVLPDLLKEEDPKESFKQLMALILGIVIMAFVTNVFE